MGKVKRPDQKKNRNHNHHDRAGSKTADVRRRQHSQHDRTKHKKTATGKKTQQNAQSQQRRLKVPFNALDRVLLVGEGDFSFALSLAQNFEVGSIVATSYDGEQELTVKYSHVHKTLRRLRRSRDESDVALSDGVTADSAEFAGFSDTDQSDIDHEVDPTLKAREVSVLHGIDATKLSSNHRKLLNVHAPYTKIVFNFPHVGGLSTDVNRQVRANQQLLVGFFNAAKPLLATKQRPAKSRIDSQDDSGNDLGDDYNHDNDADSSGKLPDRSQDTLSQGHILVTLFEGEPYTLWNIRDLARHCGLQVIESFKFDWSVYPGYHHARTIGDVVSGKDRNSEREEKGSWRGEERDARCYIIAPKDEVDSQNKSKKRRRGVDNDSD